MTMTKPPIKARIKARIEARVARLSDHCPHAITGYRYDDQIQEWTTEVDEVAAALNLRTELVADDLLDELEPKHLRALARKCLTDAVHDRRRSAALAVERRAVRAQPALPSRSDLSWITDPVRRSRVEAEAEERRRHFASDEYKQEQAERQARRAAEHAEAVEEISRKYHAKTRAAIQQYRDTLRMEWTAELLDAGFSLPDGSETTWGDATVEQHRARRDMFLRYAVANTEGAARHEQAIHELTEAGVGTLRELVTS